MQVRFEDAYETLVAGRDDPPVFFSCEHASERLPAPWEWPEEDRWLVGTHWAYDIGASDLTRDLAVALGAPAVLARFSRLLVDPNRPLDSDTLFRAQAEGHPVRLNAAVSDDEAEQRLARLYRPFHRAIDEGLDACPAPVLMAVHTFTPLYEGEPRTLEVGVLFDRDERLAEDVGAAIAKTGLKVGMNEPYSGKLGMMFSADHHARKHGRATVEIEVRQDLAVEAVVREKLSQALSAVLDR